MSLISLLVLRDIFVALAVGLAKPCNEMRERNTTKMCVTCMLANNVGAKPEGSAQRAEEDGMSSVQAVGLGKSANGLWMVLLLLLSFTSEEASHLLYTFQSHRACSMISRCCKLLPHDIVSAAGARLSTVCFTSKQIVRFE